MATKIWVGTDSGNEGDWSVAANWSPSGVPVNDDDVYLEDSSQSVTGGLDQSAVALASLNIAQSFTGQVGTSSAYLQVGAAAVRIGYHDGPGMPSGSSLIKLDLGSVTTAAVVIENSGSSSDSTEPPIYLKAAKAASTIEVRKGRVGIAWATGETSTVGTITVAYVSQQSTDADVYIGSGVTLTTLTQKGGDCILGCAATTVNAYGGTLYTVGSGAITTMNAKGATIYPNSTGTISDLIISGGTVDFTRSSATRTVTTAKLDAGGTLKRDPNVVTITNKVDSDNPVTLSATSA